MTVVDQPVAVARRLPTAVVGSIGLAWAAAVAAHAAGYGHLLDHDALLEAEGPALGPALAYAAAWVVMVAAMMLPSALPLFRLYAVTSASQPRPRRLLAVFAGGYVGLWTAFGSAALAFDAAVHRGVEAWPWLDARPSLVTGAVLVTAGAFQFTSLKDRCLEACRTPASYLLAHYRRGTAAAFHLGWSHGLFCLGCCWALMLVAFATGMSDLRLMAAFTALMAYEKIGRHGPAVARLAGAGLLALGATVTAAALP